MTKIITVLPADAKLGDRVTLTGILTQLPTSVRDFRVQLEGGTVTTLIAPGEMAAATITRSLEIEPGCKVRSRNTGIEYVVHDVARGFAFCVPEDDDRHPFSIRLTTLERLA